MKREDEAEKERRKREDDENGGAGEKGLYYGTLLHDCQRMIFILERSVFAVTILETQREASQFFQGENNRGLAMTLLDILKAHHMRFETEGKTLERIQEIWSRFNPEEDKNKPNDDAAEKKRQFWLVADHVVPLLLMQFGIDPLSANDPAHVDLLKGLIGTTRHDRLVDEKIKGVSAGTRETINVSPCDLLSPVQPGLPFFEALDQYRRLADAVDSIEKEHEQYYFKNSQRCIRWALICWADRFLKRGVIKKNAKEISKELKKDPDYRAYRRAWNRFLQMLVRRKVGKESKEIGVFNRVDFSRLLWLVSFYSFAENLFFLPHHSNSPAICLQMFNRRTQPQIIKNRLYGDFATRYEEVYYEIDKLEEEVNA